MLHHGPASPHGAASKARARHGPQVSRGVSCLMRNKVSPGKMPGGCHMSQRADIKPFERGTRNAVQRYVVPVARVGAAKRRAPVPAHPSHARRDGEPARADFGGPVDRGALPASDTRSPVSALNRCRRIVQSAGTGGATHPLVGLALVGRAAVRIRRNGRACAGCGTRRRVAYSRRTANKRLNLTVRPGTRLAASRSRVTSRSGEQGARPSRPAG